MPPNLEAGAEVRGCDPRLGAGPCVRVTVAGSPGVGKSALAVRYLTRRYIGEYTNTKCEYNRRTMYICMYISHTKSPDFHSTATLYCKSVSVSGYQVPLEVLDTDSQLLRLITHEILLVDIAVDITVNIVDIVDITVDIVDIIYIPQMLYSRLCTPSLTAPPWRAPAPSWAA